MKLLFFILPGVTIIMMPAFLQGQEVHIIKKSAKPQSTIVVNKFQWAYPGGDKPAAAKISITNNNDKNIKSIRLLVIAKDKNGVMLQSGAATLKKLISVDTIEAGETKEIYFEKAYDNKRIAVMEMKKLIVEYINGSLEAVEQEIPQNLKRISKK